MPLPLAIAVFFIIWWTVLFAILPIGVSTQAEEGSVVPGSAESAPAAPRLLRKLLLTTLVTGVIFSIVYWVMSNHLLTLDDIPFLPNYTFHKY